ncbi:PAS domain-containing sensor histidine kinase [Desulfomonile tiedjei]|uniref:histidine kinase n=1 Tax=Desulfomonile tiedjei (strain ATCC 49306 / DSM 6799 / DCB-1) TaxID=706587 RepID=I4C055_DESTA|nr:PAS domain-containing sensor histidine kinase [Desulfomonile tiedjei]AFM22946.1 PAS domain S-box [Desulfomonile tiedjei DSM 6799]
MEIESESVEYESKRGSVPHAEKIPVSGADLWSGDQAAKDVSTIREINERLRVMVETANDPIIGADSSGRIMMWNSAATRAFGYSPEEALNQPITILMPQKFVALHEIALKRAVASGRLYYSKSIREVSGRRKDGSEFPVEVSISAGKTHEGMFFTATIRDITERKQKDEELRRANRELEYRVTERTAQLVRLNDDLKQEIRERKRMEAMLRDSELLYHTLVEEVPDVIFVLNEEGRFTYLNAQAEELLRTPLRAILDTPISAYVVPEERYKIDSILKLAHHAVWDEEIRLLDADGETKFTRIRCKALDDGSRGAMLYEGVMRDITRRRRLEEQLKESREQLLEKVKIIDELYSHIIQTSKSKAIAQHTAEVAHELRQPLTIIGGFARRIARQFDSYNIGSDSGQAEAVRMIGSEIQRLEKILSTLIEFTRQEGLNRQMANPNAIIEKVLHLYKEAFEEKNLKLSVSLRGDEEEMSLDPERFEQVVRNLVSNAIDASPSGEVIRVETGISIPDSKLIETIAMDAERYFEMKIRNRGAIIDQAELPRIFSPFFTTKNYGTGIGLTVSKKIVEAHKGSISVQSDGEGTTFIVWLPMNIQEHCTADMCMDVQCGT